MDFSQVLQDFKPIDISTLEQKGYNLTENVRNSFLLYNKALSQLSSNSEDMAVIELRKAISLNPDFVDAYNLLGISYLLMQDKSKAEEMFIKVVELENNGARASKYLNMMNLNEKTPSITPKKLKEKEHKPEKPTVPGSSKEFRKLLFLSLLVLLAAVIILISVIYGIRKEYKSKLAVEANAVQNSQKTIETMQAEIDLQKSKLAKLETDATTNSEQLKSAVSELEYLKSVRKLLEADSLSAAGKYEEAYDLLLTLKTAGFKGVEQEKYDRLKADLSPKAAWSAYNQGNNLFNAGKHKDALAKLTKIEQYAPEWEYLPWVMYQIGISYREINDRQNALSTFQKLKEKFPWSEYAVYSDYRINELKGG